MIVLHYTGMQTGESALARLRDPEAKVSAHYLIEEDGRVFVLGPGNPPSVARGPFVLEGRAGCQRGVHRHRAGQSGA